MRAGDFLGSGEGLTVGKFTFALVDDDKWIWAIVKDYEDVQSYGEIVMAFEEQYTPTREQLIVMMHALEAA